MAAAVADAHRREWAFVLAATVRVTRDLDAAEECAQDAFAAALTDWQAHGIPARPGGLADHRGPAPRAQRRPAPGRGAPVPAAAGGGRTTVPGPGGPARRRAGADSRRPAAADRHLLPPGAGPAGAGGADPAADVRAVHRRGRPGLPGERGRPWPPGSPGRRRRSRWPASRTGCRRPRSCPTGWTPSWRCVHLLFTTGHTTPGRGRAGAPGPGGAVGGAGPDAAPAAAARTRRWPGCWRCCC